jgi:hypothetical protein
VVPFIARKQAGIACQGALWKPAPPWEPSGTDVLFSRDRLSFSLLSEQFWGRAARAPRDSNEFRGARYFCLTFQEVLRGYGNNKGVPVLRPINSIQISSEKATTAAGPSESQALRCAGGSLLSLPSQPLPSASPQPPGLSCFAPQLRL